jgi:aspartate/methionine/tyrosine aminotransferase
MQGMDKAFTMILKLVAVRVARTRQEIDRLRRKQEQLQAERKAIRLAILETDFTTKTKEKSALQELMGRTIVESDLPKLRMIRELAEERKAHLRARLIAIEDEWAVTAGQLQAAQAKLAQLLKRDERISAACSIRGLEQKVQADLAEERRSADRS